MRITITTSTRGQRPYVAVITGLNSKYRFDREFLQIERTGERRNCYEQFITTEDIPDGSVVQTRVADYKGKDFSCYYLVGRTEYKEISEADVSRLFRPGRA